MTQLNVLALRTRALHVGEEPDPTTKSVEAPLILSTNFVTDPDSSGFSAVDLKDGDPYLYARWPSLPAPSPFPSSLFPSSPVRLRPNLRASLRFCRTAMFP